MRAAERIASGWGALLRVLRARMLPQVATPFDARIVLTLCRCRPLMPAPACTSWAHCPPLPPPLLSRRRLQSRHPLLLQLRSLVCVETECGNHAT